VKEVKINDNGVIKIGLLVETQDDLRVIFKDFFQKSYDELDESYAKNMFDYVDKDDVIVLEGVSELQNGKRYPLLTTYHQSKIL
jgi:hypothetical protein